MKRIIISLSLILSVFSIDMDKAVQHLISHANAKSTGWCARYVANALQAGGFSFQRQGSAYLYHTNGVLKGMGYREIRKPSSFRKGDITVTERNSRWEYGHIAMWSGSIWISDFRQTSEFVYAYNQPPVHYYRYGGSGDDPQPQPQPQTDSLVFTYAVRTTRGKILPEVHNTNDYAGIRGVPITDIAIKVNKGFVNYRVHVKGGDWLPYVNGYNWNDSKNGYAGNGKPIDLVQIKFATFPGYPKYRVSPVNSNYYSWQNGVNIGSGQDGYAGAPGKAIDRIQIAGL